MPRIVSLISSATEILNALGQIEHLVGRSHECDYPECVKHLPVCTAPRFPVDGDSREIDRLVKETLRNSLSVYDVFDDVLEHLQPTHILTQIQCDVCAVSLQDVERSVAARLASRPKIVSLQPNSLADVWDDFLRVATALGIADQGENVVHRLRQQMEDILREAVAAERPAVACIEWIEPLMAAGNWTPELVAMAGGRNLFGSAGTHSPWMSWEELAERDPDVIVVAPCGFDLQRACAEMHWLTDRSGWPGLRAVRTGRVFVADGNRYFNRPGPRLVESLRILAEVLYPERFEPSLQGHAWREWRP